MAESTPIVDELMFEAFDKPRTPRSEAYKAGVRTILAMHIERKPVPMPYDVGTSDADAYFSGHAEGHAIWDALKKDYDA